MPDNLKKVRPEDATKINLSQPYEVNYWCDKFGCSKTALTNAVKKVGVSAKKVKEYLKSN